MGISENRHSEAMGRALRLLGTRVCGLLVLLALACIAEPAAAEELGRLFLTPQQRQDLERRRTSNRVEEEAPQIMEGPLRVDGQVRRSSGKTTTWINSAPEYDNQTGSDPARVTVVPNPGEPGISLKVGQTYERTTNEVRDLLSGGEIAVGKAAPEVGPAAKGGAAVKSPAPSR